MDKSTVNMTNWQLYVYDENYRLSGIADKHPTLGKNAYVSHTSSLVDYSFADDVLIYETRNTIYVCPIKYMNTWPYRNVVDKYKEQLTHRAEASENILDMIIASTATLSIIEKQIAYENQRKRSGFYDVICMVKKEYSDDAFLNHIVEMQTLGQDELAELQQKESERLIGIACDYADCVYIEVSNVCRGSLLAYHLGDFSGVVEPYLHSGMFQDSVLYMKYARKDDPCSLDFRYFPKGRNDNIMETYSWSDNIKVAVIKNDTDHLLQFNNVEISVGETKVFTPEGHRQGLISPDCHNGKSIIMMTKKSENSDEEK